LNGSKVLPKKERWCCRYTMEKEQKKGISLEKELSPYEKTCEYNSYRPGAYRVETT